MSSRRHPYWPLGLSTPNVMQTCGVRTGEQSSRMYRTMMPVDTAADRCHVGRSLRVLWF